MIEYHQKYLIPESLETSRLLLRLFKETDWPDLHRYYSDPACTKYTIKNTLTEAESWRTMAGMIGHIAIFYRQHRDPEKRRIVLP